MSRLTLLIVSLCAVKVLAMTRLKRAAAENAAGEVLGWGGEARGEPGGIAGARFAREAKKKKDRSTSSSSGEKMNDKKSEDNNKESIGLSISEASSGSTSDENKKNKKNKYKPESTEERHGWRKWHRKCHRCPEEEKKKWRDPSIKWICGAYQRAHRSFKSLCMMHYRNCQDGTMFVKIHDHRCANASSKDPQPRGLHFFYDYKVKLSEETSSSNSDTSSSSEKSSSSSS